jgi:asparagine synthase (glutamine-hydrolysing)
MCGIAGIFSKSSPRREDILTMADSLKHRGPDASGYYVDEIVALGHRRLSILDLDARSHQPFFSQNKRYVIVFNGEIFNFKQIAVELRNEGVTLHTTSDTEVLLEAFLVWGVGFVHKLNGMFAFAIYDIEEQKLFLFRDRVGKKPLYYYHHQGTFLFASELKAILKHPLVANNLSVNKSTISDFLQLGYMPEPRTFYNKISKFPAGHYGILTSDSSLSILSYWNISHYLTTSRAITESQAFDQLKVLVNDSVNLRLVADVPVGIFLSGGIDSSLVAAVASKTARLKTFSIGFDESKFDESKYSQSVADHLGTEHYSYILKERDAVELVGQYIDHFDEPFADTSAIPTMLLSRLAREKVTVALTGDGGDELFLGYGMYTWANRLANPCMKIFRPLLKQALRLTPSSRWKRANYLFNKVSRENLRKHIFSQEQYFFSDEELKDELIQDKNLYPIWKYDDFQYLSILSDAERQALFDFQFYLRDDLLVKVDRASMFYGLECRSPLLDYRLAEFSINLPEQLKKKGTVSKYLLKKMLYEIVPEKFFNRPKWGFSIPLAEWMRKDLNYLMKYLCHENLNKTNIFNPVFVNELIMRFNSGETYLYNRLWTLIIIQKYLLDND